MGSVLTVALVFVYSVKAQESCIKAGEVSQNGSLGPGNSYFGECCSGLTEINNGVRYNSASQSCTFLEGSGIICSACGNGTCEKWENPCNCPQDCSSAGDGENKNTSGQNTPTSTHTGTKINTNAGTGLDNCGQNGMLCPNISGQDTSTDNAGKNGQNNQLNGDQADESQTSTGDESNTSRKIVPHDVVYSTGDQSANTSNVSANSHRTKTHSFVSALMKVANQENQNSDVGSQIEDIAWQENNSANTAANALDTIQSENPFESVLFGVNNNYLDQLNNHYVQSQGRIAQLYSLADQVQNANASAQLVYQARNYQQEQDQLRNFIEQKQNSFSPFGWIFKLFGGNGNSFLDNCGKNGVLCSSGVPGQDISNEANDSSTSNSGPYQRSFP